MWLCDYRSDIGVVESRIQPYIMGRNRGSGEVITPSAVVLRLSAWLPMDGYYEETGRVNYCKKMGRARRLVVEEGENLYVVDYYQPFIAVDWTVFDSLQLRVETVGESYNEAQLNTQLRKWYGTNT